MGILLAHILPDILLHMHTLFSAWLLQEVGEKVPGMVVEGAVDSVPAGLGRVSYQGFSQASRILN